MTDAKLRELVASLAIAQAKTDAQLAKTDAKPGKLAEMYGGMDNNQDTVAERFISTR